MKLEKKAQISAQVWLEVVLAFIAPKVKEVTVTGKSGCVLMVTEVTRPNVEPPPPRRPQKRSVF
jgi:hypothetical protein